MEHQWLIIGKTMVNNGNIYGKTMEKLWSIMGISMVNDGS